MNNINPQYNITTINIPNYIKSELNVQNYERFEQFYSDKYKNDKIPITIGGVHGISVPATIALSKTNKKESTIKD
ncbi:MAG: arginase family protein [DPANN group archaeon]|nr:arginase family protein [DPANN group archaeon]